MDITKKSINQIKRPMNNDYLEIENADGMPGLVDSTIALDFLLSVKSAIRNSAMALTEMADQEARKAVHSLLDNSINLHAELTDLMIKKGWLHPYDVNQQFQLDKVSTQTALQIASLQLFKGDTSRLGTFATPNY